MQTHEDNPDEIRNLRRTMRDLVALSVLPAVWTGYGPDGIAQSLADVLLNILSLDLLYIRLHGAVEGDTLEVVRGTHQPDATNQAQMIGEALAPWLQSDPSSPLPSFANPFG